MEQIGSSNIEVAQCLTERDAHPQTRVHMIVELVEALVLAVVAVATAWSGYQAALWAGLQSQHYSQANELGVQAEGAAALANEERLYNASTVVEWLKAEMRGEQTLADLLERRLLPEFRPAFEAWRQTDPLTNPKAPPGPQQMAAYHSSKSQEAATLNRRASEEFEEGNRARRYSDDYVRVTVLLATVLLLTAISQRFQIHLVRVGLAVIAMLMLCIPIYRMLALPRV